MMHRSGGISAEYAVQCPDSSLVEYRGDTKGRNSSFICRHMIWRKSGWWQLVPTEGAEGSHPKWLHDLVRRLDNDD